jgi:EpsD family peptidyl-prolyl cis-trans isomerase
MILSVRSGPAFARGALACALTLTLSACGGGGGSATQVAAKVNKEEISVHQVNYLLQRQPGVTAATAAQASQAILDKLIEQSLVVQRAVEQKVDRDPAVMQGIEMARRDMIARAYVERAMQAATPPSGDEVQKYFAAHPELFTQRRVYVLDDVEIEVPEAGRDKLREMLQAEPKGFAAVQRVLQATGLPYSHRHSSQPGSALSMDLLKTVSALAEGERAVLPSPAGLRVLHLASSQSAPLTLEQARPQIERFLLNERRRQIAEQEAGLLREGARIERLGDFAKAAPAGAGAAASAPVAR